MNNKSPILRAHPLPIASKYNGFPHRTIPSG
jgi:hypothetical protein